MVDSDPDEDGSAEVSCQEQQNSEGDDDVEEVAGSGSRASVKPILRLPERNDGSFFCRREPSTWHPRAAVSWQNEF
jgi:hypothetical protein